MQYRYVQQVQAQYYQAIQCEYHSLSPYSLYLLRVIQQAAPKQQQQTMTMGTDTSIAKRISKAITMPTTAPGVRPADREHDRGHMLEHDQ